MLHTKTIRTLLLIFLAVASLSVFAESKPEKKAILITGASSGLGLKMTEVLSSNGFFVYATARKEADLKRLNAMENVESVRLDVLKPEQISAAVEQVQQGGRGLYGLINNAGVAIFGPMIEVPSKELEYQLDVNVVGPYRVLQAFAPMIIESKGRIATTGSIAGTLASPMYGQYSMSKHAIEAFTDSLAAEMQRFDVQVGVITPGSFASNIGKTAKKRVLDNQYWAEKSRYAEERKNMLAGLDKVLEGADPLPVAEAALDFMQSDAPKLRYMVVPNERQAQLTLRKNMSKLIQQNSAQAYKYDAETLINMFSEEVDKLMANSEDK
ncbi:MAG: SDR family oxidoreductase [Acidiferrobacterales bacterium]|nr:SDR family oxidoreductase [Acidiferrobacterales bacterium]